MASTLLNVLLVMVHVGFVIARRPYDQTSFSQNYAVAWGGSHASLVDQGAEIQLSLDKDSGAGFGSKLRYNSGFFRMRIKLSNKDTAGVVTALYLSSLTNNHDELDFEFLGNKKGKPISLQTNIFTNSHGNREQRIHLWFDPTADFHDYRILWNPYHVVFFVDNVPIRVFKNQTNAGIEYPSQPMQLLASLWNGEDWATDGGRSKINWTQAPFTVQFRGFNVDGCASKNLGNNGCSSPELWWNTGKYTQLTPAQLQVLEHLKKRYMTYDYCTDKTRFRVLPPECHT